MDAGTAFIDKSENFVISPQFNNTQRFLEGLAVVKLKSNQGYINKLGTLATFPQSNQVNNCSDGRASVGIDGKYGYINSSRKIVISIQFKQAFDFSND